MTLPFLPFLLKVSIASPQDWHSLKVVIAFLCISSFRRLVRLDGPATKPELLQCLAYGAAAITASARPFSISRLGHVPFSVARCGEFEKAQIFLWHSDYPFPDS